MQLLHPWFLVGLALVPVAVLLHVFRAPGRRHEVSSLGLWQGVLDHARPEAGDHVKRFDWLLLLEVLIVALLVLGLAWPVIWTARPQRMVGYIYDISASMNTVEADGVSRLQEMTELLRLQAARLPIHETTVQYQIPTVPWSLRNPHETADLAIAPETLFARGMSVMWSAPSPPQVAFLLTDKPPAKIDDPRVRVVAVGGASRNAGIVAFSGEGSPDGSLELFVRVVNYADAEQLRRLVVTNASKELASDNLHLPPNGGAVERVFKVRVAADDAVVRVKLEGPADGFAADDEVAGVVKPLRVCSTGDRVNAAYARLFGGTVFEGTTFQQGGRPYSATFPDDALVIVEGVRPQTAGAVMVLLNPTTSEVAGIRIDPERSVADPAARLTVEDNPLTKSVDVSDLKLDQFRPLTIYGNGRALMSLGGIVVAASGEQDGHKVIVVGFDPTRAGWTLKPSFVVFWANVLAEAKKAAGAGGLVFYRTGDAVSLPFEADEGKVNGPPSEGKTTLAPGGWSLYTPNRVGVYEWTAGTRHGYFAANLLSEIESDNRPSPLVGKPPSFDLPAPLAGRSVPLGPWLCLAAGILAALWWQFRK